MANRRGMVWPSVLAGSLIAVIVGGCASTTSTGNAGAAASAPAAVASAPARVSIGVVVPTLNAQFWTNYVAFMKKGADELGVDLTILNADNKPDQMASQLEELAAKKVNGIIFTAYWNLGKKGLGDAKAANIPVIITDAYISDLQPQDPSMPNYLAFVGPSDETAGFQMAEALIAATPAGSDGKKYIAVVDGTPGTSVAIDRHTGLQRSLAQHPDVVVAGTVNGNFVQDTSQTAFASLYQGHPEIKGVWAANGGTATGVMTAIKNAGKTPGKDIMVVAMDLNPENVTAVKNGELLFDIGGHWLQGGFALVMMYDYLHGLPITASQANVKLELLPLTKDKVAQFEKDFPNGQPVYDFKQHSRVYNPSAPPATFNLSYTQ
jgi:ABC-type sugar transport system substrate-binding protein